jgi:hypothetical protein
MSNCEVFAPTPYPEILPAMGCAVLRKVGDIVSRVRSVSGNEVSER